MLLLDFLRAAGWCQAGSGGSASKRKMSDTGGSGRCREPDSGPPRQELKRPATLTALVTLNVDELSMLLSRSCSAGLCEGLGR